MKWKLDASGYHAISDCGNYHVSRCAIGGKDYFDSWYGSMEGNNLRHLHGSCDKAAAMQACDDDLNKRQQSAASTEQGA